MSKTQTLELPLFSNRTREVSAIAVDESYQALKKRHEAKARKFDLVKYLKVGGAIAVAAAAGAWYHSANKIHVHNVTETVRPYERAWNVAERAEREAGVDIQSIDLRSVSDKITARYGNDLRPGQKIVVPVESR